MTQKTYDKCNNGTRPEGTMRNYRIMRTMPTLKNDFVMDSAGRERNIADDW